MYLISFRFDDSEHLKCFSLFKGVVRDTFLSSPTAIYYTVHGHLLVHSRIELESHVIIAGRPSLEIYFKSAWKFKYVEATKSQKL